MDTCDNSFDYQIDSGSTTPHGSPSAGGVYTNAVSLSFSNVPFLSFHSSLVLSLKNCINCVMASEKLLPSGARTCVAVPALGEE